MCQTMGGFFLDYADEVIARPGPKEALIFDMVAPTFLAAIVPLESSRA